MRLRRRRQLTTERQPDGIPKVGLFTEPVRVVSVRGLDPEVTDQGERRVTFLVEVRDAEDRRCPDLAVQATVAGPSRSRTVQGTTDMLGRIRFRTSGPPGDYAIDIVDVAAGGLAWDRTAGPIQATLTVP